jgi:hypothetical protein
MAAIWKRLAWYDDIRSLFEIDVNGDLEPVTDVNSDPNFELDGSGDIEPKAA